MPLAFFLAGQNERMRFVFVLLLVLAFGVAHVQEPRPSVGLVLSGGGARGLAHVGVLKVLEAQHIRIDAIAGASMGAIVGGLCASGLSAQEVEREVRAIDWTRIFEPRPERQPPLAAAQGRRLRVLGATRIRPARR